MKRVYSFLKSIKLAVVLILVITVTSLLSTLIPQGKDLAFYYHNYPPFFTWLILTTRFNNFFRSFIFIAPSAFFFVNLLTCTIDRFAREIRKKERRRFGPDLLHVGLLILLVGSVITFAGRKEGFMTLGEGDQIKLPGGYLLTLESFEFLTYENGSPKDWISTVNVEKEGSLVVDSQPIEVNKPLKVGNIEVFQNSYSLEYSADLVSGSGETRRLISGDILELPDSVLRFVGNEETSGGTLTAVFELWENRNLIDVFRVRQGGTIAGYTLSAMDLRSMTGLQAVVDPGFVPVLIGLLFLAAGLFLTYYQKLGEKTS